MTRRKELEEIISRSIANIRSIYPSTLYDEPAQRLSGRLSKDLTTFIAQVERECWQRAEEKIEQLMEKENESTDDQIWEYRDWCRAQKEGV